KIEDGSATSLAISADGNSIAIGSPATGAGAGLVRVYDYPSDTVAADLYAFAALAAGLEGSEAAPGSAPFGDEVANLVKYAFNLDLSGPDARAMAPGGSAGLPSITRQEADGESMLRIEFIRRLGSGLIYTPMVGESLAAGSWSPAASLPQVTPIDHNWERVVYLEPVPGDIYFGVVEVILP
ncbi:MAG: hypothetical protein R3F11_16155, partial [Verrucomicrobiales bacterium]